MFRILIVDDEHFERDGVKFLIDKFKLKLDIAEADSGEAALAYMKEHPVDILLTDIRMREMDGLQLSREAKALQPRVKIVILSAYGKFEYAQQAIDLQAVQYILKPVEVDNFLQVLHHVIALCESEREELEQQSRLAHSASFADQAIAEIAEYLKLKEPEEAQMRFVRLFDELKSSGHLSVIYVKYICSEIVRSLLPTLRKRDSELFQESLEAIFRTTALMDLREMMLELFRKYEALSEPSVPSEAHHKVVDEIIRLIEQEYQTDLSVENIAERVYLTPSYLSHLFAKQTGVSLIKYLTIYRLEKAKQLLQETNRKIVDIGVEVGYANYPYFCTLLKNHFGKTPSQLREEGRE